MEAAGVVGDEAGENIAEVKGKRALGTQLEEEMVSQVKSQEGAWHWLGDGVAWRGVVWHGMAWLGQSHELILRCLL